MLVGEDLKKGRWKEEDGVAGHCDRESIVWCASRASLWHWSPVGAGRVSGLLFWLVWDFLFFSHFPSLFLGEVSPRSGSQAGASETTSCLCHQLSLALSVLPYWLNRWRTFEWQAPFCSPSHLPQTQHTEESSIFIPSPTLSLPFCVLSHSYVNSEIKHMVLICNKSTVTQADSLLRIFSESY